MTPTDKERCQFLHMLYFGTTAPAMKHFIKRAYLDMCRTLHGLGKLDEVLKAKIYDGAVDLLQTRLVTLGNTSATNKDFDDWHCKTCAALIAHYERELDAHSTVRMSYGQAQKWINMTLKYCWFFGSEDLQWLHPWLPFAHVAVDEVILIAAVKEHVVAKRPCDKWSTWQNEKNEYQDFQAKLRAVATQQNKWPLELEAAWWEKHRPAVTLGREED